MKKILIIVNSNIGYYFTRKELMSELVNQGYQVYMASINDGFVEEIEALGVTYIETPYDRRGTSILQDHHLYKNYLQMLKKRKPDIVLAYTAKPNIYGNMAAHRLKIPVIANITGLGDTFLKTGLLSHLVKFLYRTALKKTPVITFQNQDNVEIMRRANVLKNQRVVMLPGSGVNLEQYIALPYPEETVEEIRFLFVGRYLHSKGIGELITATRNLKKQNKYNFKVTLIGYEDDDVIEKIKTAVAEGIVEDCGFQKDVLPFLEQAHCMVLPSYSEGTSNALLEAAASARPLITTNTGGCRETVDDGVSGFLCEVADATGLEKCMERFLTASHADRVRMGQASRRKMEQTFDRKIVIEIISNEIKTMLQEA